MMWDKLEYPPQPFGQCSICSRHDCGEVVEDGVKKQKWLHVPLELFAGGDLHIGYQCVRGMSEDLGVAVRVVEKVVEVQPSDEQIVSVFRNADKLLAEMKYVPPHVFEEALQADMEDFSRKQREDDKPKTRQRRASK